MTPKGAETRDTVNLAQAVAPDRLLRGEPADTRESWEALRWINIYQELVTFNLQLMELVQKRIDSLPLPEDGPERPDLLLIQAHYGRLCLRLDFWKQRCLELRRAESTELGTLSFGQQTIV